MVCGVFRAADALARVLAVGGVFVAARAAANFESGKLDRVQPSVFRISCAAMLP
jgi:hypothetical protein